MKMIEDGELESKITKNNYFNHLTNGEEINIAQMMCTQCTWTICKAIITLNLLMTMHNTRIGNGM